MPNDYGLYDMSGNLFEWTHDSYTSSLGTGATTDPVHSFSISLRVVRGGGWLSPPKALRSAERNKSTPEERYSNVGFRVGRRYP